jgi:hypothetical protein
VAGTHPDDRPTTAKWRFIGAAHATTARRHPKLSRRSGACRKVASVLEAPLNPALSANQLDSHHLPWSQTLRDHFRTPVGTDEFGGATDAWCGTWSSDLSTEAVLIARLGRQRPRRPSFGIPPVPHGPFSHPSRRWPAKATVPAARQDWVGGVDMNADARLGHTNYCDAEGGS